jgi:Lysyl oxidase/Bacterial Ig domain
VRSWIVIAAACALVVAVVSARGPERVDAAAAGAVPPDLAAVPPTLPPAGEPALVTHGDGAAARLMLRFSAGIDNVAPAPASWPEARPAPGAADMRGARASSAEPMRAFQRLYDAHGDVVRDDATRGPEMLFEDSDGHDHWHLMRAARYTLRLPGDDAPVAPAMKVGFCFEDGGNADAPEDMPPFYEGANRNFCEVHQPGALSVLQGLQPGWRDIYMYWLALQWIDVSDVQPGPYRVRNDVDPDDIVIESHEANAPAHLAVTVPGHRARALTVAADAGSPREIELGADRFGSPGRVAFRVVSAPLHGTLDVAAGETARDGVVTYTPAPGHSGPDSFTYAAVDATSPFPRSPAAATVALAVGAPTPRLALQDAPGAIVAGTSVQLSVARDFDASPLTWSAGGVPGGTAQAGTITTDGLYSAPSEVPPGGTVTIAVGSAAGGHDERTLTIVPARSPVPAPLPVPPPASAPAPPPTGAPAAAQPALPPRATSPPPARVRRPTLDRPALGRVGRWLVARVVPRRAGIVAISFRVGRRRVGGCRTRTAAGQGVACRLTLRRGLAARRVGAVITLRVGRRVVALRRLAPRKHGRHRH